MARVCSLLINNVLRADNNGVALTDRFLLRSLQGNLLQGVPLPGMGLLLTHPARHSIMLPD